MDANPSAPLRERLRRPPSRRDAETAARRRRLLLWVAASALVLAVLFTARPAYQHLLRWRARAIVSQAQELIRQQLYPEAIEKLESALRVDPRSAQALRSLAEIYGRFELPAALPILRALAATPDRTDTDLRNYIDVALKLQRFDLAEAELTRLLAQPTVTMPTRLLATEFFYRLGDLPRALSFANELRKAEPTNNAHHLRAAKILLGMPNPTRQLDGINLLGNLNQLSPTDRVNLAEILASAPALPPEPVKELLPRFPLTPDSSPLEYFLRADVDLRVNPDPAERSRIVASAAARYQAGTAREQADLCAWLLRLGEHAWILRAYSAESASKHPEILLFYLEALGRAGRWADYKALVETTLPFEAWQLQALRAHAAAQLNQTALAEEHWRRAFAAVADSPSSLRNLGDFALRLGTAPVAIQAFKQLSETKLYRGSALRRLALVYQQQKDTEQLRLTMKSLALGADNPFAENAYCYLSALLFKEIDVAHPRAEQLFAMMPSRVVHRATLAFLELRRGDTVAALRLFDRAAFDLRAATPQTRLVYALVLDADGQHAEAREALETVNPDLLLPEEKVLFERLTTPLPNPAARAAKPPAP